MSMDNFRIVRFFYYFQNETGKKTQNVVTARGWIEKGKVVKAVLSDGGEEDQFKTDAIKQINVSEIEYKMVLLTEKKERIFVKLKFPKSKYIKVSYFYLNKDLPENQIPKIVGGKKTKSVSEVLDDVKVLVDKGKDVHAVYQDECKVITSRIVEFNLDKKYFVNDCGITYFMT